MEKETIIPGNQTKEVWAFEHLSFPGLDKKSRVFPRVSQWIKIPYRNTKISNVFQNGQVVWHLTASPNNLQNQIFVEAENQVPPSSGESTKNFADNEQILSEMKFFRKANKDLEERVNKLEHEFSLFKQQHNNPNKNEKNMSIVMVEEILTKSNDEPIPPQEEDQKETNKVNTPKSRQRHVDNSQQWQLHKVVVYLSTLFCYCTLTSRQVVPKEVIVNIDDHILTRSDVCSMRSRSWVTNMDTIIHDFLKKRAGKYVAMKRKKWTRNKLKKFIPNSHIDVIHMKDFQLFELNKIRPEYVCRWILHPRNIHRERILMAAKLPLDLQYPNVI
ncbi:hypothetical protein Fmac_015204 [Flemingia macrophylla]|uniref:Transposase n=1 Tax=Flemingia macrophylla TaxID=520843 RepID=A0ABD1MDY6_9FABA